MTPEQDFERHLADWLADGPKMAPPDVVDGALAQTAKRRQRRGVWRWLVLPLERIGRWFPTRRAARLAPLAAVLVGVLLTSAVATWPFGGDPGSPPSMDEIAPRAVVGSAEVDVGEVSPTELTRLMQIDTGDQRIDGQARQELSVLVHSGSTRQLRGTMRLENDWGAWEGAVDIVRYPSGEEYEYAALSGSGTYEGFTYHYIVHQPSAEAERTVEGAIWPDEPPSLPDPSLLP